MFRSLGNYISIYPSTNYAGHGVMWVGEIVFCYRTGSSHLPYLSKAHSIDNKAASLPANSLSRYAKKTIHFEGVHRDCCPKEYTV